MDVTRTAIPGVLLLTPRVLTDARGYFFESYNSDTFARLGIDATFIQDNQSFSQRGVLRGLHFQLPPHAQGKLVRVIRGAVRNAAVDLRKDSPTFGKHVFVELNEANKQMLWLPPGIANGFVTLENDTVYFYKVAQAFWHKESEQTILWNDPDLAIAWGVKDPIVAEKDQHGILWKDFASPFA